jgi:hypothetical protein
VAPQKIEFALNKKKKKKKKKFGQASAASKFFAFAGARVRQSFLEF